ncbi:MAG: hypothetical protein LBG87_07220, partial [Spirochaetaceae bacterium]|nr:hypothetical protein [Spirochaetaceae bacterium]
MNILGDIISRTPLYAWVILAFLIYRGLQHRKDRKVSLLTSCIAPAIFIIWGLANVFISFAY